MTIFKMATAGSPGGQSPTSLSRTIEKVFEDAQSTGEINLSGRKLKEYPSVSGKYDLVDTTSTDLSKNRMGDIPAEVCDSESLECLNCYHNVIKCIPEAILQLQSLVQLNLSRNQLTTIPPFLCQLQSLEVLRASNNRLVSLPEEIGQLDRLMDLDVSCNEITHLPSQMGDLESLQRMNVRRNLLVELPAEISKLPLQHLDCSSNKITNIPCEFRKMEALESLVLDHNPLVCPPAHICTKGRGHIIKFLESEAIKEDRKRGVMSDVELRRNYRKSASIQPSNPDELRYGNMNGDAAVERRKRHTVDSGYSTTDSSDKSRWSPSEHENPLLSTLSRAMLRLKSPSLLSVAADMEDVNVLALRAAENVKEQRQRHQRIDAQRRMEQEVAPVLSPSSTSVSPEVQKPNLNIPSPGASMPENSIDPFAGYSVPPQGDLGLVDEFTRELHRQKSEYEARKRRAEQLRMEREREDEEGGQELDERRRAAVRLQEDQKALLEQQRQETRRHATGDSSTPSSMSNSVSSASISSGSDQLDSSSDRRLPLQSQSFKEEKKKISIPVQHLPYRRTVSDTNYHMHYQKASPSSDYEEYWRNNSIPDSSPSSESLSSPNTASQPTTPGASPQGAPPQSPQQGTLPSPQQGLTVTQIPIHHGNVSPGPNRSGFLGKHNFTAEEEYRLKHEAMIAHQRHEATMVRRRLEVQKQRIRQMQKDAVNKWAQGKGEDTESEGSGFSRDSTPNTSFNGTALNNHKSAPVRSGLPPNCKKLLEAAQVELDKVCPGFTIRRNILHAQEEVEQVELLRKIIESRLKVTLPEDLPAALKDGVVLCHLANHVRPRSVSSIHVPSPAVPKLSVAKCRRNVENFLDSCRRMGVDQKLLCPALSVLEESGIVQLAKTVQALVESASKPSQATV